MPYVGCTQSYKSKNYKLLELVDFAKMNSLEKGENLPPQFAFAMAKLFCKPANEAVLQWDDVGHPDPALQALAR